MSKTYFISDVHLGLENSKLELIKEQTLLSFLNSISNDANALYILGDLFDTWLEYKKVIPKGFHRIISKLDEFVQNKTEVHYLAGNHDYWMNDYFSKEIGIQTYSDAFETTIDGKKFYLHHGDGLILNDKGYKFIKKIFRHPINIKLYKLIHPDLGIRIAQYFSRTSRKYSKNKQYSDEDGMKKEASKKIEAGFDIVIMGHCHQPHITKIGEGIYVNLGDWITHYTYAVFKDGEIELNKWNINKL